MNISETRLVNIKKLIEASGSQVNFSKETERTPQQIAQWLNKTKNVGEKIARDIELKLGLDYGYLDQDHDKEDLEPNTFKVPEYNVKLSAGHGIEVINPDNIKKYHVLDEVFLQDFRVRKENLAIVQIIGDSMHPTLLSGELVVIDTSKREPIDNTVFAITTKNHTWAKRYRITPDGGKWQSDNPRDREYDDMLNNGSTTIVFEGVILFSLGRKIN